MLKLKNGLIVQPVPHKIGIADDVGANLDDLLKESGLVPFRYDNTKDPDKLLERLHGAHGVVTRTSSDYGAKVLRESGLVVVQGACKGTPADVATAERHGIEVLKADANREEVVALLEASLSGAATGFVSGNNILRMGGGRWPKKEVARAIIPLSEARLGVIGLGDIGQAVSARFAKSLSRINGYNRRYAFERAHDRAIAKHANEHGVHLAASIEEVIAESDVLTLHVDKTDSHGNSNNGLITEQMLRDWGKKHRRANGSPQAIFVNLARACLAPDIHTLNKLLFEGVLHSAIVDAHPKLWETPGKFELPPDIHPSLQITPHIGGSGEHISHATAVEVADTLSSWIGSSMQLGKSRINVHQTMDTSEVVTEGTLGIRIARSTGFGSANAVTDAIKATGFNTTHPGKTYGDRKPGSRDTWDVVPTVLAVDINGTAPGEAAEKLAIEFDRANISGQCLIAVRFLPTTEEMREGVMAYTNQV